MFKNKPVEKLFAMIKRNIYLKIPLTALFRTNIFVLKLITDFIINNDVT